MGSSDDETDSIGKPVVAPGDEGVDTDEVLVKTNSDVYHLKNPDRQFNRDSDEPACSINNHKIDADGYRPESIDRALEKGKKHCTYCVRWLKRTTDVEIHKCKVCERISIANDNVYMNLDIEEYPSSDDEVRVCTDCIVKLHHNILNKIESEVK